jgi:hypothetical protein
MAEYRSACSSALRQAALSDAKPSFDVAASGNGSVGFKNPDFGAAELGSHPQNVLESRLLGLANEQNFGHQGGLGAGGLTHLQMSDVVDHIHQQGPCLNPSGL